jgi:hypothetical protein|tara:strand:+ start:491 stop:661 length:171 start_codon:yes stop_codon:yes gene_type:complete
MVLEELIEMLYGFEIAVGDALEPIQTQRRDDSDGQEFSQLAFCSSVKIFSIRQSPI